MKKITILIIALINLAISQNYFEGKITIDINDIEKKVNTNIELFSSSTGKLALNTTILYNADRYEMKIIYSKDKVYLVYDKEGKKVYSELTEGNINKINESFSIKFREEGEVILNHKTEKIIINTYDKELIYYVAKDIKLPFDKYKNLIQDFVFVGLIKNGIYNLPLKLIVKEKKTGNILLEYNVSNVEEKQIENIIFELPEGIEKVPLH